VVLGISLGVEQVVCSIQTWLWKSGESKVEDNEGDGELSRQEFTEVTVGSGRNN
jgi:hypothetical protein